jgi:maleate isomerase
MKDAQGWRAKFGVLGPSTNTIVQPDFDAMRPVGVTNHYSRIFTPNSKALSNETFLAGTKIIANNVLDAVTSVMTCEPDYLVMGMSAITFYGGVEGAKAFEAEVTGAAGVGLSCGSIATAAALRAFGGVKKIAFLSPYYPAANDQVRRYFEEEGFEVGKDHCLQCPSWVAISQVQESELIDVIKSVDGEDIDAIVQVGTNLSMVRLAAAAERWLAKPVVAINAATYWHALRANGIEDRISGLGRILEEF